MFPLSLEAKLIAGALALAALLGGFAWFVHHEQAIGAEKVTAAVQHAADVQTAKNVAETARRDAAQQENAHEADKFNTQRMADARGLDASAQRVRVAASSGRLAPSNPAAPEGGPPADAPAVVRADLFLGLVDVARQLAEYADSARGAGQLCAADYDALTP